MSLVFLSNATNDINGIHNNDYQTTFRQPMSIPPFAKVSVESAFIPINQKFITIATGVNDNLFITCRSLTFPAPPLVEFTILITLTAGTYTFTDFCTMVRNLVDTSFQAPIVPTTPAFFSPSTEWSFSFVLANPEIPLYGISVSNFLANPFPAGCDDIEWIFNFNTLPIDTSRNALPNILGMNNQIINGIPIDDFGVVRGFKHVYPGFIPGNLGFDIQIISNQGNANGRTLAQNSTKLFIVEIQQLGTQLYNSLIKDMMPAVCVIPYTDQDVNNEYVLFEPPFPLELHCSNEQQDIITTLTVRIREGDGKLADVDNPYERTYINLRLETNDFLEKQALHQMNIKRRLEFLENSLVHKLPK